MTKRILLDAMFSMFAAGSGKAWRPAPGKAEGRLVQGACEDRLPVSWGIPSHFTAALVELLQP